MNHQLVLWVELQIEREGLKCVLKDSGEQCVMTGLTASSGIHLVVLFADNLAILIV